jgi:polyphosphate kinase
MPKSAEKKAARLEYNAALKDLQIHLVDMQIWAMAKGRKIVILFEGRDASGKDGTIKRIVEHLAVRNTRVVALPKPSDRDRSLWWFQRYVEHLPAAGEIVIFNRSCYNRTGVERVMGFSTPEQQADFLNDAPNFEHMLVEANIVLIKIWLDIDRDEQVRRLKARRTDPLKRLKVSAMDDVAEAKWCDYSVARNEMLTRTSTATAPWVCVRAGHKKTTRLNVIRHILHVIKPPKLAERVAKPDPQVLFFFDPAAIVDGRLAP